MPQPDILIQAPTLEDGAAVAALVREAGALEPNTTYAYLLLCHHFAETCGVARRDSRVVGCVLGYRIPARPDVLFVWQVGIDPQVRGQGLASRMLDELVARPSLQDVRALELTIAPSNEVSNRLFNSFAARHGWSIGRAPGFESQHFGAERHEEELLISIKPNKGE